MQKQKYSILKNPFYAISGLKYLFSETSFVIEFVVGVIAFISLFFINVELVYKIFMIMSIFIIFITEALNTAIERAIDLETIKFHLLAKQSKDIASGAVFLSISNAVIVWGIILYEFC